MLILFARTGPLSRSCVGVGVPTAQATKNQTTLGGHLAATQPIEKLFSRFYFGGPNGLFPPGNPSIEVGGEAPPPQFMGFPEGRGRLDPPRSGLENNFSMGWVAARGTPRLDCYGTLSPGCTWELRASKTEGAGTVTFGLRVSMCWAGSQNLRNVRGALRPNAQLSLRGA